VAIFDVAEVVLARQDAAVSVCAHVRLAVLVVNRVDGIDFTASLDLLARSLHIGGRHISAHRTVGRGQIDAPVRTVLKEEARAQDVALVDVKSLTVVAGRCQYCTTRDEMRC
jgi:hypothetical protein